MSVLIMSIPKGDLFWLLIGILVIAVSLVAREVFLWFWKINKRVELLEEQNILLEKIYEQLGGIDEEPPKKKGKYEVE